MQTLSGVERLQGLWRRDIRLRVYAGVALMVLLSTVVFTTYSAWTLESDSRSRLQEKADSMANLLAKSLARPLFDINTQAVQSVVSAVGADASVRSLMVTSAEGTQYRADTQAPAPEEVQSTRVQRDIVFRDNDRVFEVGRLELTLAGVDLQTQHKAQLVQIFWANLVLALLIVGLLYTVGRRLSKPLVDARRALDTLSSGRTDITLSGLEREDQLGRLVRAVQTFQRALQRLHETERELLQANTALEARIAARTAHLQSILDASLDAVILTDPQGVVLEWGARAQALLGWTLDEARGRSLPDLVSPPELAATHREWLGADHPTAGLVMGPRETEVLHRDGTRLPVEWALVWLWDRSSDGPGPGTLCCFVRDIRERHRAESEALAALQKQAELFELRSRFIAMASHEFRTPLTSILSSTELLRHYRERLPAQEQADLLTGIERAVQRMTLMLERVLVLGQADAQTLEFHPRPLDLSSVCQSIVLEARSQHPASVCSWSIHLPEPGVQACLDENLLRHLLGNLLTNALKYSPEGGQIGLSVTRQGAHWVFEVSDEGIGIPASDLPHLFESFHRAHNARDLPGTGLGLAIAQRAARVHGAEIEVDSVLGQGSRFTVRLPDAPGLD